MKKGLVVAFILLAMGLSVFGRIWEPLAEERFEQKEKEREERLKQEKEESEKTYFASLETGLQAFGKYWDWLFEEKVDQKEGEKEKEIDEAGSVLNKVTLSFGETSGLKSQYLNFNNMLGFIVDVDDEGSANAFLGNMFNIALKSPSLIEVTSFAMTEERRSENKDLYFPCLVTKTALSENELTFFQQDVFFSIQDAIDNCKSHFIKVAAGDTPYEETLVIVDKQVVIYTDDRAEIVGIRHFIKGGDVEFEGFLFTDPVCYEGVECKVQHKDWLVVKTKEFQNSE